MVTKKTNSNYKSMIRREHSSEEASKRAVGSKRNNQRRTLSPRAETKSMQKYIGGDSSVSPINWLYDPSDTLLL